jgi:DNA-binding NarL/FixJ family response regulator
MLLANPEPWATSVLLIDANDTDRAFYAKALKQCSSDYVILEAANGKSGLELYRRSPRIDCVVLDLSLPGESSFLLLTDLNPIASRPYVAVIVLTDLLMRGLGDLARKTGAFAVLVKKFTSGEDLDIAIQRAIAHVGALQKEDRPRAI